MDKVVVLVGPTASGKTDVVAHIAKKIPLEVISCDSMQVYTCMRVLSQAPGEEVRKCVPHHLVEMLDPAEEYNAARFCLEAGKLIASIRRRKRVPFIVGGTGLYVSSLLDGLFEGPGEDERFRARWAAIAEEKGVSYLYARLESLDGEAAAKIHPHDARRIIRALEVIHTTGDKFSRLKKERKGIWDPGTILMFGLRWDRGVLYERINRRVEQMFRQGLAAEVKALLGRRLSKTAAMCLGLREVADYLKGAHSLEAAKALLKQNTRRYAKRQISWFGRDDRISWIDVTEDGGGKTAAAEIACRLLSAKRR